jgi:hypothetical protein
MKKEKSESPSQIALVEKVHKLRENEFFKKPELLG